MKKLLMSVAAAFALTASVQADSDAGYTIEMDFKIENVSAGVIFACPDVSNFYMWQINLENPEKPKLRPHRWVNGGGALIEEFEIGDKVDLTIGDVHKLKLVIDDYKYATTYIDDEVVDERREGDYPYGMLGFRQSFAEGKPEVAYFDNIKVTRHEDGKLQMNADFTSDNPFDKGELVDGWFKAEGVVDGENRFFGCPYNDVHFALECDVNLVKDDVAFVFAEQNPDTYYMWALNCFDGDEPHPRIRHHMFRSGNLEWNDAIFTQFSKSEILDQDKDRKVKIEVVGAYIYTYIDGVLVDRYMDWNANLKPGLVGFRIDTTHEQDDDAWIDNVVVTNYDENDNPVVVLSEDFSNPNLCWFPEAIVEEKDGDRKMHIYGDGVLYKWMQLPELAEDAGYTISTDFEIDRYNVGLCFAGSKDMQNFYMWQVNTVNPDEPMLRPHKWTNGGPALFGPEVKLPVDLNLNEGTHTLKLVITNNANCATYIDGRLVDNRSGYFEKGLVGFREDRVDAKGSIESGYYDNILITSNEDNSVIYSCDFSNGNPFSNGELIDGRLYFKGDMNSTQYAWQCDWNDVWYTVEADMTLMKDDVAFIFSHIDENNYYMWSIDAFDREEMMIRAHIWENGQVRFDDISFFNFSKEEMLEKEHHVTIEVRGALISTYIDGELVNRYVSFSDKLVGGCPIGIRIDTRNEQNDDAYIDNIKVTDYELVENSPADSRKKSATLKSYVVLEEDFEDPKNTWFPDAVVESYNGSNQLHIYTPEKNEGGQGALIKLMQAEAPGQSTGVNAIGSEDPESNAEYFNLQGIRVANPQPGTIYIVRKGSSSSKQIAR